ncbi:MAG: glycosyltransferase [Candidatus Limiplasma sp.]|nr:glycosyltransferase [Candidatus Limiplasma sp.]
MKTIFAIMPCYNEQENIGALIDAWLSQQEALLKRGCLLQIIAIDDSSTDRTGAIVREKAREFTNVSLVSHGENRGLCGGVNTAIRYFLTNGKPGDLMVLMDGDNTQEPRYILPMLEELAQGYDCVIASRYQPDSGVVGLSRGRTFLSDMARLYYRFMLRVPRVQDYTCGYRVYRFEIMQKLTERYGEEPVQEKTFACMMELLFKLHLAGAGFSETGFTLRYDNKGGESKMRVLSTMKNSLVVALKLSRKRENRP